MKKEFIEETFLPNGVRIVTEKLPWLDTDGPVAFGINVAIGSAGNRGKAHAVEHMCLYGESLYHAAGTLKKSLTRMGYPGANASTDLHNTFYGGYGTAGFVVCKEDLAHAFALYANAILFPTFDKKTLETQRGRIIAEYEGTFTQVCARIQKARAEMWSAEWLIFPTTGTTHDIKTMTAEDLRSFHATHYRSNLITIAAAGNIAHQEIVDLACSKFERLTRGEFPNLVYGDFTGIHHNIVNRPLPEEETNRGQTNFNVIFPDRGNTYEAFLLNRHISIIVSKLLFETISHNSGLVYDIGSNFSVSQNAGEHSIYFNSNAKEAAKILKEAFMHVQRLFDPANKTAMEDYAHEALAGFRKFARTHEATSPTAVSKIVNQIRSFGKVLTTQDQLAIVENFSFEQAITAAQEIFSRPMAILTFNDPAAGETLPNREDVERIRRECLYPTKDLAV